MLLQGRKQDEDRPATHAAAEVLAGLLASGTVFHASECRCMQTLQVMPHPCHISNPEGLPEIDSAAAACTVNVWHWRSISKIRWLLWFLQVADNLDQVLRCHATGRQGAPSAWDAWVKAVLTAALDGAPMDLHEAWSVAMRYAVHWLSRMAEPVLALLLPAILQQPAEGVKAWSQ